MWILKVIMCVFNCVIFLAGGAAVLVGVLVEYSSKYLREVLDNIKDPPTPLTQLPNVGYLLIAVGSVLAIIGFLGCCGAMCESKCLLLTFFIIILILFLAEVAGAVLALVFKPKATELLEKIRVKVSQSIQTSYGKNDGLTTAWNETMNLMKCCGYNNYNDFTGSPFVISTSNYPIFCCPETVSCTVTTARAENAMGCFSALVKLVQDNSLLLAGVAICIAAIEVCAMIASMMLYKT
ncbi:tetraspanin-1-like isoform X2 [Hoplias malabaricus]